MTVSNTNADENGNFQTVSTNIPGISYSYSYTENGRLKTETNPSGLTTTYQYQNGDGYLNRISSPFETESFNEYDAVGNLLNYSNSRGITSTYAVNQYDEVTSETASADGSMSPLNYSASYSYFKNGNLQSQDTTFGTGDGAVQNSSNYTYDSRDNLLTETESARGTTNYTYDGSDNLTSISNGIDYMSFNYDDRDMPSTFVSGQGANAGIYSFTYDGNGNMVTSTDPYGHVTSYQFDGYDRVKTITDPLGNAAIISRAEFGNLLMIKNIASSGEVLRETARINDPLGRMTQYTVKVPGGTDEIYNYTYAEGGKTVTITDSLNRVWTVKKNDFGQVYEEKDAAGNKTEYFYLDGRGNMTKKVETEKRPDGSEEIHTFEYRYNAFNKIEEIKENVGTAAEAVTKLTYDCQGNLDGSIDGEGNTISHKYDSLGRKIRTKKHFKDGTAVPTDFTYYANNLLKTIKDSKGNTTTYEYDNQKRLTKIIYPDNSSSQYTYTTASVDNKVYRSVVEKQRNGTVVTSLFDELNRLKSRNISPSQGVNGVTTETYDYDALSRVTRAVGDDFTVDRKYDSLNRVSQEKQMANLVQYTHSVVDNRRKMAVQYSHGRIFERDFDILDRISKLSQGPEHIADFSYIGKAYRVLSKQCGNGDAIEFVYDQGRRLNTKETKNRNQGLINKYIYGYNKVGMKMFEQRGHDGNKGDAFSYDEIYRLTGVKFNSPEPANPATDLFEKRWASQLDKVDNILKIVQQTGSDISEITPTIEGVNAQLNQYTRFDGWGLSYDLNGNTTQRGTQHITYDYRNRIVSVQGLSGTVNFKYDPFNRRVEKTSGSDTVKYLYDGDQVIEERDGNDNVLRQYVWGSGIDELICIYVKGGDNFKAYYPHTNGSGSITAITNDQGEVIERVTYDVYGMPTFWDANNQPLANNQSTIGNNYLFQGREYDKETNLYYYRARYYDPIMGRFLQTDPMGYEDSMNLYQGFNMNPVNFLDPFGLERVIVNSYMMNGGPKTMKPAVAHNQYPTFAGQFKIYSIGKHTSPQYYPMLSSIPWGSPLRLNSSNEMEVQINGVWKNIKDVIPDASVRPSVHDVAYYYKKYYGTDTNVLDKFGFKVPSNQKFATSFYLPDSWVLNDFGHVTVKMYSDNNNNGKFDPGEENREYFHPTPDVEALITTGTNPNDISERILGESHGCMHVKPNDIDEMIAKKYMSIGNQVVIHPYDDDLGVLDLRNDPSGQAPFVIHVFPGKFKILIEGEK